MTGTTPAGSNVNGFKYVAMGDSQSEGVGDVPWPDGAPRGWADRLAQRLGRQYDAVCYANLAIRGKKAREILGEQLGPALALEPDLVTISAGVNDLLRPRLDLEVLEATMAELVTPVRRSGAVVVLVPAPDGAPLMPLGRHLGTRVAAFNQVLRRVALETGAIVLPLPYGSVFSDPRAWSADRLHLNALGHDRLSLAAGQAVGLDGCSDWAAALPGRAPGRTLFTELRWWYVHGRPWVLRRLRGQSSGDGREPKLRSLVPVNSDKQPAKSN